jgi:hypothetical protein
LAVERLDRIGNRYERHQMSPRPATGLLQLLSASGSVSTVRPSGPRGIRERTQAGQAVLRSMRLERVLVVGRPCDLSGCALSADP